MVEKVIVAIDGGAASSAAMAWAVERARTVDLHLQLVAVADADWSTHGGIDPLLVECQRQLDAAVALLDASGVRMVRSTLVRHDTPLEGLLAAAHDADLLVVGSHKANPVVGLIHGTLPLTLATRTAIPLVVVPATWQPDAGHVVVGIDDESGHAALAFAAIEASRDDLELIAVRGWDVPALVANSWATADATLADVERMQAAVLHRLIAPLHEAHGRLVVRDVLQRGRPSLVLSVHARGARLLVVGTDRRRALRGCMLGSVGHDVLMNMVSAVAIVPERAPAA